MDADRPGQKCPVFLTLEIGNYGHAGLHIIHKGGCAYEGYKYKKKKSKRIWN